jgi:large subunit ribosomal protein L10
MTVSVNREKKEQQVTEMSDDFKNYESFYLVDFMRMPVSLATDLRNQLRKNSCSIKVVKNRLAIRALQEDFPEELMAHFQGPTAIAFSSENPLGLARLLKDFSAQHKVVNVKAGLLEGQFLSKDSFGDIANLTSKEDLLAKLGFMLAFPLTKFLSSWKAPLNAVGSALSQLKNKK